MPAWFYEVVPLALTLAVYVVGIIIFLENRSPHRTLYWFLILAFLPVVGLILYLYFGRSASRYKYFSKMSHADVPQLKEKFKQARGTLDDFHIKNVRLNINKRLPSIISAITPSYITVNNHCRVLNNGREKFEAIFAAMEKAQHHIHLEYFIVRNDYLGNRLKEMLVAKARKGVKVRFLYDGLGSRKLGRKYLGELREAGIEVAVFQPINLPMPSTWMNYRNHRKILVVDGKTGFLGGLNIGDEYIHGGKRFPFWRDTHLEIKGEALDILQGIFVSDWEFTTGRKISEKALFPGRGLVGGQAVQIAASGPDGNWEAIHHAYFTAIATARRSVYITTPYLILDDSTATALKAAALSGVDVKIVFPGTYHDHKVVYWASFSYFTELLRAGVQIYLYQKGFVHAKTLTVDSEVAVIGTANMDMRSFYYSFEINAFIYNQEIAMEMETAFLEDVNCSTPVSLDDFYGRPLYAKFKESGARLLSPLL